MQAGLLVSGEDLPLVARRLFLLQRLLWDDEWCLGRSMEASWPIGGGRLLEAWDLR